jgi:hypothetical protein
MRYRKEIERRFISVSRIDFSYWMTIAQHKACGEGIIVDYIVMKDWLTSASNALRPRNIYFQHAERKPVGDLHRRRGISSCVDQSARNDDGDNPDR